jgi:hypothetical protein
MHSYSIDSDLRIKAYLILGAAAALLPSAMAVVNQSMKDVFAAFPTLAWPLGLGATYSIFILIFDKWIWKQRPLRAIHGIPDLNGIWDAKGLSSYQLDADRSPSAEFSMTVTIRQTFSRMEVFTQTNDSTSRSTMASICSDHAVTSVRYAYENTPKSKATPDLQRHPGLIELRVEDQNTMVGDYFSGKHRLRYGELTLTRRPTK